jgi:hypothetical protein
MHVHRATGSETQPIITKYVVSKYGVVQSSYDCPVAAVTRHEPWFHPASTCSRLVAVCFCLIIAVYSLRTPETARQKPTHDPTRMLMPADLC